MDNDSISDQDHSINVSEDEAQTSPGSPAAAQPTEERASSSLHYSLLGPSLLKAGQDGVDQTKVGEIIYNASKGSKFFAHEEKRDEQLTKRITAILKRKNELEATSITNELRKADEHIAILEKSRDLSQTIVHVDCDAFYASVEELARPELKKVPMAVGGGVLTTCNYEARKFGVRSGMAGHIAKKICPQLVFIPLNFGKYTGKAEEIQAILVKYDARFEAASIDEAFLNITKYLEEHPDLTADTLVEQIRAEVLDTTKISISAGIGPNAKIAKIASNKNKPNGQFRVSNDRDAVMDFMSTLPVRKVNGVGRVFERELEAVGIKTCGDIYPLRGFLRQLFGDKAFDFLMNCCLGIGRTTIRPIEEYERKSVGTESTFRDLSGTTNLKEKLKFTAEELEKDLKKTQFSGRVLVLKVKLHTYQVYTRQRNLGRPISTKEDIYNLSLPLLHGLEAEFPGLKIRLMGLRVTGLISTKKEAVDMNKWFFGNSGTPHSSSKRKPQRDENGWEVWPEEEFERVQAVEKEEEMKLTQELDDELAAKEKRERGLDGWEVWPEDVQAVKKEEEMKLTQEPAAKQEKEFVVDSPEKKTILTFPVFAEPTGEKWECPICGNQQPADDALFNQHMDFCLSKEAIRSAVHESTASGADKRKASERPPKKKRRFTPKR
ncbi:DNA-directed polymerase kappa [Trichophaea hybrida]|nr:DNA-directed polymerase kappa [Trichophaea hybrida]